MEGKTFHSPTPNLARPDGNLTTKTRNGESTKRDFSALLYRETPFPKQLSCFRDENSATYDHDLRRSP